LIATYLIDSIATLASLANQKWNMLQAINLTNSSSHDVSYLTLLVETYLNKSAEMKIWADAQNIIVMHT
jgi:hypothetical protein